MVDLKCVEETRWDLYVYLSLALVIVVPIQVVITLLFEEFYEE